MPYEDKKAVPQRRPHAVTLDERSHLTVTGVDEVVRFDDTEVSMRTSRGMLTVHGEGLRFLAGGVFAAGARAGGEPLSRRFPELGKERDHAGKTKGNRTAL